jgi:hypothetical protein
VSLRPSVACPQTLDHLQDKIVVGDVGTAKTAGVGIGLHGDNDIDLVTARALHLTRLLVGSF